MVMHKILISLPNVIGHFGVNLLNDFDVGLKSFASFVTFLSGKLCAMLSLAVRVTPCESSSSIFSILRVILCLFYDMFTTNTLFFRIRRYFYSQKLLSLSDANK